MSLPSFIGSAVKKLCALLLGLLIIAAVLELVARRASSGNSFKVAPTYFKTLLKPSNSLGFHDYEYPPGKAPGVFRILVVGDSFTEGASINFDDTYPKRLERYLNLYGNKTGTVYEVLNASKLRRSTPEEVMAIKELATRLDPDMIILGYCLNDAEDWEEPEKILKMRNKYHHHYFREPTGWLAFLYDRSALVRLVMHRAHKYRLNHGYTKYYHTIYDDDYPGWHKTKKALCALGEFSRSAGVPSGVVILPLFSFGFDDNYPFSDVHATLHGALEEAGLLYIDLFPFYRGLNRIRMEATPNLDPHPSEIAHRVAAQAIWSRLKKSRLLPPIKRSRRTGFIFRNEPPFHPAAPSSSPEYSNGQP